MLKVPEAVEATLLSTDCTTLKPCSGLFSLLGVAQAQDSLSRLIQHHAEVHNSVELAAALVALQAPRAKLLHSLYHRVKSLDLLDGVAPSDGIDEAGLDRTPSAIDDNDNMDGDAIGDDSGVDAGDQTDDGIDDFSLDVEDGSSLVLATAALARIARENNDTQAQSAALRIDSALEHLLWEALQSDRQWDTVFEDARRRADKRWAQMGPDQQADWMAHTSLFNHRALQWEEKHGAMDKLSQDASRKWEDGHLQRHPAFDERAEKISTRRIELALRAMHNTRHPRHERLVHAAMEHRNEQVEDTYARVCDHLVVCMQRYTFACSCT